MGKRGPKVGQQVAANRQLKIDILRALEAKGFDPVKKILSLYDEAKRLYDATDTDPDVMQFQRPWLKNARFEMMRVVASDLMEYVYPKQKSVALTNPQGGDFFTTFAETVRRIHEQKALDNAT